ncbi:hypothetical protein RIF29_24634 [Crotalaria pallida]|uniref:Uncharacterized protein n=1 Tax=Crotalaria pallida TaxID=3830 RepID=A0AAN9EMD7_CROPI
MGDFPTISIGLLKSVTKESIVNSYPTILSNLVGGHYKFKVQVSKAAGGVDEMQYFILRVAYKSDHLNHTGLKHNEMTPDRNLFAPPFPVIGDFHQGHEMGCSGLRNAYDSGNLARKGKYAVISYKPNTVKFNSTYDSGNLACKGKSAVTSHKPNTVKFNSKRSLINQYDKFYVGESSNTCKVFKVKHVHVTPPYLLADQSLPAVHAAPKCLSTHCCDVDPIHGCSCDQVQK